VRTVARLEPAACAKAVPCTGNARRATSDD